MEYQIVTCRYIFYSYWPCSSTSPEPESTETQKNPFPRAPRIPLSSPKKSRPPPPNPLKKSRKRERPGERHFAESSYSACFSTNFPLSLIALLFKILSRSIFNFNLMMLRLLGLIPTGVLAPLTFSFVTRSTWTTHFLR